MLNYWPEEVKFCYEHKHYCCISKSVLKKIKCKFVKLTDHHAYDMEKKKRTTKQMKFRIRASSD